MNNVTTGKRCREREGRERGERVLHLTVKLCAICVRSIFGVSLTLFPFSAGNSFGIDIQYSHNLQIENVVITNPVTGVRCQGFENVTMTNMHVTGAANYGFQMESTAILRGLFFFL